jgi:hypothetical protein
VASIGGFWWALRASAGVPATPRFDDLRRSFGSVRLYRLDVARRAARDLRWSRRAALLSVIVLSGAALTWWWAHSGGPVVAVTHGTAQSCGTVAESDTSGLRLSVEDSPTRLTIPWSSITAIKPVTSCSTPN